MQVRTTVLAMCFIQITLPAIAQAPASGSDSAILTGADERIDRFRKGNLIVEVVDRSGEPLPEARVKIEQVKHQFLFGCAAISLFKHKGVNDEDKYQKRFSDLFNFATVLTYWHDTEPERNKVNYDRLSSQVKRLKSMGITVKGHPLILAGASPKWAPSDPEETRKLTERRISDMAGRFRGQIDVWDVVGDATTASGAQTGLGAWARKAGPATLTADAFRWARAANPKATLMYNDYKLDAEYTNLMLKVFDAGAPLDALGLEAHMIGSEWSLEKAWQTAETFGRLGKPLHFSEITVLSDDPRADHSKSWPTTPEGEQRQAEYVEKLYTVLFSHPAVSAIGWWNFVDGDWDRNPGGLLRADLSPKPAYERLMKLIHGKWNSSSVTSSDAGGVVRFRGFGGHYRITVTSPEGVGRIDADITTGKTNTVKVRAD